MKTKAPKQLLFFSRGKGRGHAIPDVSITNELLSLEPDVDITFVSYSAGAATLKELGHKVLELELPEDNPLWDTVVRILPIIQEYPSSLVVSHEEPCVVPLAKASGLPVVYLTDWFINPDLIYMQALKYADRVIFLDYRSIYDEPSYLAGKVLYVGPVLRPLESTGMSKAQCRSFLRVPEESTIILCCPGGAAIHSEVRAPIFDVVLGAYDLLDVGQKRLLWVAGDPDYTCLAEKYRDRSDVMILRPHYNFTPTIMAADLVITKGNRLPLLECEALGIPSISISHGYNFVDDYRISSIRTNTALRVRGLEKETLREYIAKALASAIAIQDKPRRDTRISRLAAAKELQDQLRDIHDSVHSCARQS